MGGITGGFDPKDRLPPQVHRFDPNHIVPIACCGAGFDAIAKIAFHPQRGIDGAGLIPLHRQPFGQPTGQRLPDQPGLRRPRCGWGQPFNIGTYRDAFPDRNRRITGGDDNPVLGRPQRLGPREEYTPRMEGRLRPAKQDQN